MRCHYALCVYSSTSPLQQYFGTTMALLIVWLGSKHILRLVSPFGFTFSTPVIFEHQSVGSSTLANFGQSDSRPTSDDNDECVFMVHDSISSVNGRMCEKFHQLLAVGRWFPPGTPVSSTRKLISSSSFHRLDIMTLAIAEALNPNKPNRQ